MSNKTRLLPRNVPQNIKNKNHPSSKATHADWYPSGIKLWSEKKKLVMLEDQ
jgi:hypothetical protein